MNWTDTKQLRDAGTSADRWFHLDIPLLLLLLVVSAFGLLILYSAAEQQLAPVIAQAWKLLIGLGVMLVMAHISPMVFLRLAPWAFIIGVALLVSVEFLGDEIKGSRRWLHIGHWVYFQPSELMKLLLPMLLAWYYNDRHLPPSPQSLFVFLALIGGLVFLVAAQPDLGTALIIGASGMFVLFLTGIPWRVVFFFLGASVISLPLLWFALRDYQQQRILILLDPEGSPLGAGWNIIQSKTAIGSGGLFGKGLFAGTQSHYGFLPERQTDFIIAVIGEELGLLGILFLLFLYLALAARGVFISITMRDTFGRLLSGSIAFAFFVYVLINIGMVSGILPVVGVPLPFVSYGGSSILIFCAGFGILMSLHTHSRLVL